MINALKYVYFLIPGKNIIIYINNMVNKHFNKNASNMMIVYVLFNDYFVEII